MSHVVQMKIQISDLDALDRACRKRGLELVRDQKTYKWWGRSVGDYPIPEGFTAQDLGKCDHAIRIPGNQTSYEIGVVKSRTGPGYVLLFDFYGQEQTLVPKVGKDGGLLGQAYATEVTKKHLVTQGYQVHEAINRHGDVVLTFSN
jgi:hypothetical protein